MINIKFPKHVCLELTHNEHTVNYDSVEAYIKKYVDEESWISKEEKEKAISTNEIWELIWYPDTPGGYCSLCASSLEALLDKLKYLED
jgi:hypothetical protein